MLLDCLNTYSTLLPHELIKDTVTFIWGGGFFRFLYLRKLIFIQFQCYHLTGTFNAQITIFFQLIHF